MMQGQKNIKFCNLYLITAKTPQGLESFGRESIPEAVPDKRSSKQKHFNQRGNWRMHLWTKCNLINTLWQLPEIRLRLEQVGYSMHFGW